MIIIVWLAIAAGSAAVGELVYLLLRWLGLAAFWPRARGTPTELNVAPRR